jgi:hypothetical protein
MGVEEGEVAEGAVRFLRPSGWLCGLGTSVLGSGAPPAVGFQFWRIPDKSPQLARRPGTQPSRRGPSDASNDDPPAKPLTS